MDERLHLWVSIAIDRIRAGKRVPCLESKLDQFELFQPVMLASSAQSSGFAEVVRAE